MWGEVGVCVIHRVKRGELVEYLLGWLISIGLVFFCTMALPVLSDL